ncbi:MAG: MATE family efflux transporter [Clostridia bacterium]|nr:MATE family efflux transporter [Clostridia bacterium]
MNKDLTVGKPQNVLWRFCMPLFGSIIFQQLYNIADSFVSGKFVGESALAAVGNSYEITLLFIAFAFGCNIGCSVVVSRLFGAKKYDELKTAVYTTFISSAVLCAILMSVGLIFSSELLKMMNTPDNIFFDSELYLKIYIWSFPFVLFYNVATGIFSALGDSKTPFVFLMISSVSNIGMDILFVTAFATTFTRGVDGVAWATLLCQGISCVLALFFVLRRLKKFRTEAKVRLFSFEILKDISAIAIPSILQQSFISVGNIIIQGVINSFGSSVIAGYSAAVKLNNLVITSFTTIGNGISNYTAQNIGAEKLSRIHSGFKAGLRMVWILCTPLALAYFFGGRYLVYVFLDNPTGTAMEVGITFLRIVVPFYFVISAKLVADGILRGAGMMKQFMVATFTDLVVRVVLAQILPHSFGSTGIWLAWPFGWVIGMTISTLFYRLRGWHQYKE